MAPELQKAILAGLVYLLVVVALPGRLRRLRTPLGLAGVAVFLIVVPLFMPKFQNDTLSDYAVYVLAALSLNLLIGRTGQISLGTGALLAISAYTVGILMQQHHVSFYLAGLIGALLATAVGLLLGLPAVRLTGPYLAIATLGLAISLPTLGKWTKVTKYTGGAQGISLFGKLPKVPSWLDTLPGGHQLTFDEYRFYLTLAVTALCALVVWNLSRSSTGRAFVALRDSEPAAQVMGINLARYKVLAFGVSAFIAGLSGAFLALRIGSVFPDTFGLDLSLQILAMIVIGGLDSILGSVVGAVFLRFLLLNKTSLPAPTDAPLIGSHLPAVLHNLPTYGTGVYYGACLILVMLLMPYGLAGAYYRVLHFPFRDRLTGRRRTGLMTEAAPSQIELEPDSSQFARPAKGADDVTKEVTRS